MVKKTTPAKTSERAKSRSAGRPKKPLNIDCGQDVDIGVVSALHARLVKALSEQRPVVINAREVESISGAALQLLAAFTLESKERKVAVTWEQPSDVFVASARTLGLEKHLRLPT